MPRRPESDQIGPTFFFKTAPDKNDQSRLHEFDEERFGPEKLKPMRPYICHFAHQTRTQKGPGLQIVSSRKNSRANFAIFREFREFFQ